MWQQWASKGSVLFLYVLFHYSNSLSQCSVQLVFLSYLCMVCASMYVLQWRGRQSQEIRRSVTVGTYQSRKIASVDRHAHKSNRQIRRWWSLDDCIWSAIDCHLTRRGWSTEKERKREGEDCIGVSLSISLQLYLAGDRDWNLRVSDSGVQIMMSASQYTWYSAMNTVHSASQHS